MYMKYKYIRKNRNQSSVIFLIIWMCMKVYYCINDVNSNYPFCFSFVKNYRFLVFDYEYPSIN